MWMVVPRTETARKYHAFSMRLESLKCHGRARGKSQIHGWRRLTEVSNAHNPWPVTPGWLTTVLASIWISSTPSIPSFCPLKTLLETPAPCWVGTRSQSHSRASFTAWEISGKQYPHAQDEAEGLPKDRSGASDGQHR